MALVTFDFHNTIASCDTWFELEIRSLPAAVARTLAPQIERDRVTADYRDLRASVMASGVEIDAYDGVRQVFERHGVVIDPESMTRAVDAVMKDAMVDLQPIPGVQPLVHGLRDAGCTLGVVSSAVHHAFIDWSLEQFGLTDAFAFVLSSARAGMYKSNPAIYTQALDLGNTTASAAVHIGDSLLWDVEQAASVGMRTVWLDHGTTPSRPDLRPDLVMTSFDSALPTLLDLIGTMGA